MTIRSLPVAPQIERPDNIRFEIPADVLARWHPEIRALASDTDNNVISILDQIGDDGEGGGFTSARMAAALRVIGNKAVEVHINSPGGNFFEGIAMYEMLREHPKEVTVKVLALAGSAASVIAMAGDTIMAARASFFMIHNTTGVTIGDKNSHRRMAAAMDKFDTVSAEIYAARSGIDAATVARMMNAATWMSGAEAIDNGFADQPLPSDQTRSVRQDANSQALSARRQIENALTKGEQMSRSKQRKLLNEFKELTGTPCAAETEGTPRAANDAVMDGETSLRFALARMKLATA